MTDRVYHIVAITLLVAGIALGAVCWVLDGTAFWIVAGVAALLAITGLYFAGRVGPKKEDGGKPQTGTSKGGAGRKK
jgi:hypothetical protein